ncbi:MAG: hypothetical protein V4555_13580 [Acidobacteriota bacterium]
MAAWCLFGGVAMGQDAAAGAAAGAAITLHVTRSSTVMTNNNIRYALLWATVDGKKLEMAHIYGFGKTWALLPGDYTAHVTDDSGHGAKIVRDYEIEVEPGKKEKYVVIGVEE